ncbi:hypothetical protein GA0070612_1213 [Micromonospora chokoriensis]|uniref:Uncharacterized protein n=1 Tax=Micromonospora chokoriensis TaxID=356851 RepID=A0A1C4V9N6_9ACTN|nr:hypothetical protein GA0070612_1213 [Micromonospora chokoriensis]
MPSFLDNGTRPKAWPSLPLALLLPCSLLVLMGITDDRKPPPPAGVLMPATTVDVHGDRGSLLIHPRIMTSATHDPTGLYRSGLGRGTSPLIALPASSTRSA